MQNLLKGFINLSLAIELDLWWCYWGGNRFIRND